MTPRLIYLDVCALCKKGIDALVKVLGPVEATRFLRFSQQKRIESVKRHRDWQKHLDKEAFFDEVFPSQE
jgi:hypothetical protein